MRTMIFIALILSVLYSKNKKDNKDVPDTSYLFKSVEIVGYQDNPTPFYILDANGGENMIVELNRSFSDALKHNVDKEQIIRINE